MSAIEENQKQTNADITELKTCLASLEKHVPNLDELRIAIDNIKEKQKEEQGAMSFVLRKVEDLENRQRRENLLFYGIEDSVAGETNAQAEELILNLCRTKLGLTSVNIERAHRIGPCSANKTGPVIVRFSSFKMRQQVLTKAYNSRGTAYGISEDFSRIVREKRKKLWAYAKDNRKEGEKSVLRFDTLYLGDKRYRIESTTGDVIQM